MAPRANRFSDVAMRKDGAMTQDAPAFEEAAERHASWPELFFDLVAVASVSVVAHQLESALTWQQTGVLALAFTAFWILWASVTTYGNLLADRASLLVLFASMAVLGVMAAAVPEINGEHARAFAIAYVMGRIIIARPWTKTAVVVDMPIVQTTIGVIPWIVSIWVHGDARYVWWAVGIGLDLLGLLTQSGERVVADAQRRLDRVLAQRGKHIERAAARGIDFSDRPGREVREIPTTITALRGDTAHLSERMGLFVLIVLGEAIIQLTVAAEASEHWNAALLGAAVGAFALVCGLFLIAIVRGTAGLALVQVGRLPARALWIGHLLASMALVVLGSSLGRLLEQPHESTDSHTAAMLCAGLSGYALVSGAALMASGGTRRFALAATVACPMLVAGVVVAFAYGSLKASAIGWIFAAGVAIAALLGGRLAKVRL